MNFKSNYIVFPIFFLFTGCINPINRATAIRYSKECQEAEEKNQLEVAEQCCYRAVENSYWGYLSADTKSYTLFNFGRVKLKLEKYDDAIQLLNRSLELEKQIKKSTGVNKARRLIGLMLAYDHKEDEEKFKSTLDELLPYLNDFTGIEKEKALALVSEYKNHPFVRKDIELSRQVIGVLQRKGNQ